MTDKLSDSFMSDLWKELDSVPGKHRWVKRITNVGVEAADCSKCGLHLFADSNDSDDSVYPYKAEWTAYSSTENETHTRNYRNPFEKIPSCSEYIMMGALE